MARYADAHLHHVASDIISSDEVVTFEACADQCRQNAECTSVMFDRAKLTCTLLSTGNAKASVDTYTKTEATLLWAMALGTDVGVKASIANGDRTMEKHNRIVGTHASSFDVTVPVTWTMQKRAITYCMNTCMSLPWCTGFTSPGQTCQFYKGTARTLRSSSFFYHILRIVTRRTCSTEIESRFEEQRFMMARTDTDWTTMDEANFQPGPAVSADSAYKWFDMQQCEFVSPDF